jgi:hypothetical protein
MAGGQVEARDELADMRQIEQGFLAIDARSCGGYTIVMANVSSVGVGCEQFKLGVRYPTRSHVSVTAVK